MEMEMEVFKGIVIVEGEVIDDPPIINKPLIPTIYRRNERRNFYRYDRTKQCIEANHYHMVELYELNERGEKIVISKLERSSKRSGKKNPILPIVVPILEKMGVI